MVSSVVATGRRMNGAEMFMPDSGCGALRADARLRRTRCGQPIEGQVDDRRGVERQHLAHDQPADDGDAERAAQLAPTPRAERQRQRAQQRRHGGHHDRPEAQQAGLVDRVARATCPAARSASSAKSIIMMAFFLTMPISRMMPISAITLSSVPAEQQRQERAHAGRRQRGEDGDRVDVALVEHAQDDVDGDQRGEDQQRLVRRATPGTPARCPGSSPWMLAGSPSRARRLLDRRDRLAERRRPAPG